MDLTPITPRARYDLAHTAHVAARAHYETAAEKLSTAVAEHTKAGWALDEADRILHEARELLLEADPTALPERRREVNDPLDQFAPWPTDRDGATAEAMIAYSLVRAQASDASIQWGLGDPERQVVRMVSHFCTASLLIALRESDEAAADEAARRLWARLNDGGVIGELTWQWLVERGISPDEVSQAARDAFAARSGLGRDLT